MKYAATRDWWRGYVPSKRQGEGGVVGCTIQTFRLMLDLAADDPEVVMRKPMHLPNRRVDDLPGFNDTIRTCMAEMAVLSALLRRAFALGLGLPEEWFDPFYTRPLIQQSLLYRPAPPSQRPEDFRAVPCLVEPGTTTAYPPRHFSQFMDDFYRRGMSYLDNTA